VDFKRGTTKDCTPNLQCGYRLTAGAAIHAVRRRNSTDYDCSTTDYDYGTIDYDYGTTDYDYGTTDYDHNTDYDHAEKKHNTKKQTTTTTLPGLRQNR
jgi:hypothetical protein